MALSSRATLSAATFKYRAGSNNGIQLIFSGEKASSLTIAGGAIDILGDFWKKLPAGVGTVAQWMVPLKLRLPSRDFAAGRTEYSTQVYIGYNSLSRGRVKQVLQSVIDKGDPVVALEILFTNITLNKVEPLVHIPTKASLVLHALETNDGSSVVYDGPLPDFRRRMKFGKTLAFIRWWLCPLAFLMASWLLWKDSATALAYTPKFMSHKNVTVMEVVPPHPETLSSAYKLGILANQLELLETKILRGETSYASLDSVLLEASEVVGRKQPLTVEELRGVEQRILEVEAHKGIIVRVKGLFTFVNTIWLLAIAGMLISFGPSILAILDPIRHLLEKFITTLLRKVLIPLAEKCFNWGVFEVLGYGICWMFVAEGYRSPPETGFFISLTGLLGLVPAFGQSTLLHTKQFKSKNKELLMQMMHSWLSACWIPFALHYQSRMLGYFVVCAMYAVLGFNVACYGLCYCIGFHKKNSLHRCIATSTLILFITTLLRVLGYDIFLRPFESAISVMGSLVLFLGLLIYSSRFYHEHGASYGLRQVYMIVSLAIFLFIGSVLNFTGMFNTGIVFLVLYCVEKYTELHLEEEWNGWILIFLISLFLYRAALWLHQHPEFIASIFAK